MHRPDLMISTLGRWRSKKDQKPKVILGHTEFEDSLGSMKSCLKNRTAKKEKKKKGIKGRKERGKEGKSKTKQERGRRNKSFADRRASQVPRPEPVGSGGHSGRTNWVLSLWN